MKSPKRNLSTFQLSWRWPNISVRQAAPSYTAAPELAGQVKTISFFLYLFTTKIKLDWTFNEKKIQNI
jgi:hypothetical protein